VGFSRVFKFGASGLYWITGGTDASKSNQISVLSRILIDNSEVVIRFLRLKWHTVGTAGWIKADILTGLSLPATRPRRVKFGLEIGFDWVCFGFDRG